VYVGPNRTNAPVTTPRHAVMTDATRAITRTI